MRKLLLLISIVVVSVCSSCALVSPRYVTSRTLSKTKLLIDSCGKEVILVPMCHVGRQEHYDEIRAYLDNLKADGYVTFFEGPWAASFHVDTISDITAIDIQILRKIPVDSLSIDTLRRKMRRIVGVDPPTKYKTYKNLTVQSLEGLGQTTDRDIFTDYSLFDLIERYERDYGPVPLSDYDFEIAINDPKYKISKAGKIGGKWAFLTYYRDQLLLRRILESPHQKIAVVYGAAHTSEMKHTLRFFKGFTLDKKYNAKKAYPAK